MNTTENIPNFVNGIGVLNYTIDTKSIGTSEFYLPQIPNIKVYNKSEEYSAFGWLFGGNNIKFCYNTIDGYLNKFKSHNIPGLICSQSNQKSKFTGYCFSYLSDLLSAEFYNTCSGFIQGIVTGQTETTGDVQCFGIMKGTIENIKNAQKISVSGTLSGTLNISSIEDINGLYFQLNNISGELINTNYGEDIYNKHVINLQQTHILGRQLLSDINPLMGKQLNEMPSAINNVLLLESQAWDIIEYQVIDYNVNSSDLSLPENKILLAQEAPLNQVKLATPTYINSMSRKFSLKRSVPQEKTLFDADQNVTNEYFAFILHNRIEILINVNISYYNEDELKNFIGPIKSYEQLINILNQYANINNVDLYQINDYQFELITKL